MKNASARPRAGRRPSSRPANDAVPWHERMTWFTRYHRNPVKRMERMEALVAAWRAEVGEDVVVTLRELTAAHRPGLRAAIESLVGKPLDSLSQHAIGQCVGAVVRYARGAGLGLRRHGHCTRGTQWVLDSPARRACPVYRQPAA